jgi:hypothetical protein
MAFQATSPTLRRPLHYREGLRVPSRPRTARRSCRDSAAQTLGIKGHQGKAMEFTLTYRGPLRANGDRKDKQHIRRKIHQQMKALWQQLPLSDKSQISQRTDHFTRRNFTRRNCFNPGTFRISICTTGKPTTCAYCRTDDHFSSFRTIRIVDYDKAATLITGSKLFWTRFECPKSRTNCPRVMYQEQTRAHFLSIGRG